MTKRLGQLVMATVGGIVALCVSEQGLAQSSNVAIIDSPSVINGGSFPTSGGDLSAFNFVNLPVGSVNASNLAVVDTALLNVASPGMGCSTSSLSDAAKAALVSFLNGGGKLIIYDSECSSVDYSWLPTPFTTNNPGAAGAQGVAELVENDALGTTNPGDPEFVDLAALSQNTDAVGDANVMTTRDPAWCLHMSATNVNLVSGPAHTYARVGQGLLIYNGFDVDYMPNDPPNTLTKLWTLELKVPFDPTPRSALPCRVPVVQRAAPAPAASPFALLAMGGLLLLAGVRRIRCT